MPLDNDDIKQLIAILQKGLSDNDTSNIAPTRNKTVRKTARKPKTDKPKQINKFEQMSEFNMCKEDVLIDQKIIKPPPSARLRDFEPMKVRCRVCGKTEKVAPNLIESIERYKCNKCSTGAG
jgi:translation initiation factor 2 beta subunit (eIF-2beta)/eIF-5